MKMKKVLVMATIVMMCSVVCAGVSKAATSVFKNMGVSSATVEKGKEVTINITANDDMTIEDGGLVLKYDSSKLKYVKNTVATVDGLMVLANNKGENEGFIVAMTATGAITIHVYEKIYSQS